MPTAAKRAATATLGEMTTRAHQDTLNAGRGVVQASSPRWRRVTDGDPCGFCAMLAGRGPVYHSKLKAGVGGNRYHGFCGCTAEPFDGPADEWEPTPDEQRYIDAYDAVHQPGMSAEETAAKIGEWLKANPADNLAKYAIDGLDDDAVDALMTRLADEGDWIGSERVSELLDARLSERAALAPKPWAPDPLDAFNPKTYEWFNALPEDEQFAFLDKAPRNFLEQQWAWANSKTARSVLPTERQIRAEWDDYIEAEWVRLENATNGNVLSKKAAAAGRHPRDLLTVNPKTAKSWASEETRRYWDENGRMTYDAFKAGYTADQGALGAARAGYWA